MEALAALEGNVRDHSSYSEVDDELDESTPSPPPRSRSRTSVRVSIASFTSFNSFNSSRTSRTPRNSRATNRTSMASVKSTASSTRTARPRPVSVASASELMWQSLLPLAPGEQYPGQFDKPRAGAEEFELPLLDFSRIDAEYGADEFDCLYPLPSDAVLTRSARKHEQRMSLPLPPRFSGGAGTGVVNVKDYAVAGGGKRGSVSSMKDAASVKNMSTASSMSSSSTATMSSLATTASTASSTATSASESKTPRRRSVVFQLPAKVCDCAVAASVPDVRARQMANFI